MSLENFCYDSITFWPKIKIPCVIKRLKYCLRTRKRERNPKYLQRFPRNICKLLREIRIYVCEISGIPPTSAEIPRKSFSLYAIMASVSEGTRAHLSDVCTFIVLLHIYLCAHAHTYTHHILFRKIVSAKLLLIYVYRFGTLHASKRKSLSCLWSRTSPALKRTLLEVGQATPLLRPVSTV